MRNVLLTMVAAVVVALAGTSRSEAVPAVGAALNDAARSLRLSEDVHCRRFYHCHGWGCHVCGGGYGGYYRGYRGFRGYRGYRGRGYRGGRGFRGGGRGFRGGGRGRRR